jgi:hypothetical protein
MVNLKPGITRFKIGTGTTSNKEEALEEIS